MKEQQKEGDRKEENMAEKNEREGERQRRRASKR